MRIHLTLLFFLVAPAACAAPAITLTSQPALFKDVDAFPRIAAPLTPATARINKALAAADARARTAVAACRANVTDPADFDYERSVTVNMAGPGFLALTASDNTDCGGAHPNNDILALVYDLKTGAPVNWLHLLPASLAGTATLDTGIDNTTIGVLASPLLKTLFRRYLDDSECNDDIDNTDLHFILWPDAKDDGLDLFTQDFPFAVAPCAGPATIPAAALTSLGVNQALIAAIAAAHAAHH